MPYDLNIIGWMGEGDLIAIEKLSVNVPSDGVIVEVGSLFGKSSVAMAMSNPTAKIYCIDMYPSDLIANHSDIKYSLGYPSPRVSYNASELFDTNTRAFKNITKIKGKSPFNLPPNDIEQVDLFFLDASHYNPNDWDNIEYFLPKIKKGGVIAGHDYLPEQFPDVVENVNRLEKILNCTVTRYHQSSVWSLKKR